MSRTIVDIHILHTVPPSNLNRDDTGSPKTAIYGGTRRARVSSQAWKRATRTAFNETLDPSELGVRTKKVVELIAKLIAEQASEFTEQSEALAEKVLTTAGIKVEKPKKGKNEEAEQIAEVGYLIFLSARQLDNLAALAVESERSGTVPDKKAVKEAADRDHSIDVALFGRMVADAPDINVDAAAQVAHAISVHAVDNEYDYFTAVDDKAPEDNAGAGMIGTVEFNSSTLYRYATVDTNALDATLGSPGASAAATGAFLRAFITSMPTGKQNTFANRTLPEAVLVTIRDRQPVNLAGAFEDAVVANENETRLHRASARLADYAREVDAAYSQKPVASFVLRTGTQTEPLSELGGSVTLDELVKVVETTVTERLEATP